MQGALLAGGDTILPRVAVTKYRQVNKNLEPHYLNLNKFVQVIYNKLGVPVVEVHYLSFFVFINKVLDNSFLNDGVAALAKRSSIFF